MLRFLWFTVYRVHAASERSSVNIPYIYLRLENATLHCDNIFMLRKPC